jgi:hypothetical protein
MGKKKGGRGGGRRMFVENVEEMAMRDRHLEEERDARLKRRAESDDEDDEEKGKDLFYIKCAELSVAFFIQFF